MSFPEVLLHVLGFAAPAVFIALVLAITAQLAWRSQRQVLPWYGVACVNAALGIVVSGLGLVLTGQDGRMATYAALVLAQASGQWLLMAAGRR